MRQKKRFGWVILFSLTWHQFAQARHLTVQAQWCIAPSLYQPGDLVRRVVSRVLQSAQLWFWTFEQLLTSVSLRTDHPNKFWMVVAHASIPQRLPSYFSSNINTGVLWILPIASFNVSITRRINIGPQLNLASSWVFPANHQQGMHTQTCKIDRSLEVTRYWWN